MATVSALGLVNVGLLSYCADADDIIHNMYTVQFINLYESIQIYELYLHTLIRKFRKDNKLKNQYKRKDKVQQLGIRSSIYQEIYNNHRYRITFA